MLHSRGRFALGARAVTFLSGKRAFAMWAMVVTVGVAAAFWVPAMRAVGGAAWPAPLDDVYIHFGFARSLALGHPSTWIPGNGYSSGGTSLLYPVLLAPGWILGLRDGWLGAWAAVIAVAAVVDLLCSLRIVAGKRAPLALALPLVVLAVPVLDWTLWSGMEVAVLGAAVGRAARALLAVEVAPLSRRAAAQWRAGLWLAALPALRPEAAALAGALAVAVAHAAGRLPALPSLARAAAPTAILLAGQALVNRLLTGEAAAAGAVRKLVFTDPYRAPVDAAIEVLKNLARLRAEAFEVALGGAPFHLAPPILVAVAIAIPRTRRLAIALTVGAVGALLLVCTNTTAPFQNLRYAAPSLLLLVATAWLGADALARRGRLAAALACVLLAAVIVGPVRAMPRQIDHFARASRNIVEQQVEVGRRIAAMSPPPRRVLVGDAGAIPYVSGVAAIDGLGLGGFRGLPFARASVHGVPAVIELIERLPATDRPDLLAVYDGWWGGLVPDFGRRLFGVHIDDNVICGGDEKVVYAADWSTLEDPGTPRGDGVVDVLDVADLVDEREHAVTLPGPGAGWIVAAVRDLDGRRRWDAGRILPDGRALTFTVRGDAPATRLRIRSDRAAGIVVERMIDGAATRVVEQGLAAREGGGWSETSLAVAVAPGDRVRLVASGGELRVFRIDWLR